jgi:hypothetical protein
MAIHETFRSVTSRLVITACIALTTTTAAAGPFDDTYTHWNVQTCQGLEALVFIGALTGNRLQQKHYRTEVEHIRSRFDAEALEALEHLAELANISGTLIGPNLALLFSAGPADTLDDVILSARNPDARLRPNLEKSKYWDALEWEWYRDETIPDVLTVLLALRDAGFVSYWRQIAVPKLELRVDATREYLQRFDIIPPRYRRAAVVLFTTLRYPGHGTALRLALFLSDGCPVAYCCTRDVSSTIRSRRHVNLRIPRRAALRPVDVIHRE